MGINRKIVGWIGKCLHPSPTCEIIDSQDGHNRYGCHLCGDSNAFPDSEPPDYKTSATAMVELIEAVRVKDLTVEIQATLKEPFYQALIWPGNGSEYAAYGDTMPEAVSEAVVKLIDAEKGE